MEYCVQYLQYKTNWSELSEGPSRWLGRAGVLVLWGDAEGAQLVQLGEGKTLGGPNRHLPVPVGRLLRKWSQALHTVVHDGRTRDNRHEMEEERFLLEIRKVFFSIRITRQWSRLPRKTVPSPSLEIFKIKLAKGLSHLL